MKSHTKFPFFVSVLALTLVGLLGACSSNSAMPHGGDHMNDMDADVMFAQMMIPHHEQAVVMSDLAPTRAQDPEILALADEIRGAQAPEIELMASWLREWGVPQMPASEAMAAHGGHGMSGMLTQAQLDELAAASGSEFDRLFAIYMIEHHEGAIDMARDVLAAGSDPEVAKLAREIIATQEKEILQMQAFLQSNTTAQSVAIAPTLTHVHGAIPRGEELLVATHDGLHLVNLVDGRSSRVGESRDDFMALGGEPEQVLVASGHPGPGSSLANPLGLISSSNAGQSWSVMSLAGVVDFHALAARGDEIVGWDTRGPLQWSKDGGRTWQTGPEVTPTSIVWFGEEVWLADVGTGLVRWRPGTDGVEPVGVPGVLIAVSPDGQIVWRLDRDGSVHRSVDGKRWSSEGTVSRVEAFAADRDRAYAVTPQGIQIVEAE